MTQTKPQIVVSVLILIQILFGINFPASKVIVDKMDPVLWSNLRFFFAGVLMLIITLFMKRKHPPISKEFFIPVSILSVLGMALGQGLFLVGLRYTSSINSAILITCIPILTLLIVVIRRQEELTFNRLLGFVLSFFGVVLMRDINSFRLSNTTFIGDFLVFAAAFCFALYLSFGKKFFMKFDNMWATTYMFFISSLAMAPFNVTTIFEVFDLVYDKWFLYCAIFSILGATLLTYFLNNWALKRAPSGNVAIFIYLQPVVAGIIGFFFLDEVITMRMLVCAILIMLGLIFTLRKSP